MFLIHISCVIVGNPRVIQIDSLHRLCILKTVVCDDEFVLNFKIIKSFWYSVSLLVQVFGINNHLGSSVA